MHLFAIRGLFLESPDNFLGLKSCFTFAVFAFRIKVSILLKMKQWSYQITEQNWMVCELGAVLLFTRFWFQNMPSDPKSYRAFRVTGPRGLKADSLENDMQTLQPFGEGWLLQLLFQTLQLNTVFDLPWAKVCRFQTFLLLTLREEE